MNPRPCMVCQENMATIFYTRIENGEVNNEEYCLKCAYLQRKQPLTDLMDRLDINEEDIDSLEDFSRISDNSEREKCLQDSMKEGHANCATVQTADIIEVIKLYYREYEMRYKLHIDIIIKSILAIVFLMATPYFLLQEGVLSQIYVIFPLCSIVFCVFSIISISGEVYPMKLLYGKISYLIHYLGIDEKYLSVAKQFPQEWNNYKDITKRVKKSFNIRRFAALLYFLLILLGISEVALILFGFFNK